MLIVANNGEVTWQTETYKRRAGAYKALLSGFDMLRKAAGLPEMKEVVIQYTDNTRKSK